MNVADLREFLKDLPADMEVMLYAVQANGHAHTDIFNVAIKDTVVREECYGSRWVYPETKQRIVEIS